MEKKNGQMFKKKTCRMDVPLARILQKKNIKLNFIWSLILWYALLTTDFYVFFVGSMKKTSIFILQLDNHRGERKCTFCGIYNTL